MLSSSKFWHFHYLPLPWGQVEVIPKHLEDITEEATRRCEDSQQGHSSGPLGWLERYGGWHNMTRCQCGIMKYIWNINLYWTFRIFSAWLPQSMGSPVLPRDSCDSVLPCFTAWKRSIDWKDRKAVSCKLKAVCDHKQVRNASSPPLAGLVFPGTIELCWSTHVFQCRTSHCKVSTSSFQRFSHTFWWARQWTGTEIGTTDDPSIALDIRFASDTWWKWSTLLACGRSKLSMLDSFTIL